MFVRRMRNCVHASCKYIRQQKINTWMERKMSHFTHHAYCTYRTHVVPFPPPFSFRLPKLLIACSIIVILSVAQPGCHYRQLLVGIKKCQMRHKVKAFTTIPVWSVGEAHVKSSDHKSKRSCFIQQLLTNISFDCHQQPQNDNVTTSY